MSTQYAKHLADYAAELGGAEALGIELVRRATVHLARKEQS
jgi:hypothetical protein